MSANLESLARDAIAINDETLALDTLKAVQGDLLMLFSALTSEAGVPCNARIADFVSLVVNRIDLAFALAGKAEAAE